MFEGQNTRIAGLLLADQKSSLLKPALQGNTTRMSRHESLELGLELRFTPCLRIRITQVCQQRAGCVIS